MSIIRQDYGEVGGGVESKEYTFTPSEMTNATDTNPLVVNGDFSKYNYFALNGQYASATVGNKGGGYYPIDRGIKTKYSTGMNTNGYVGYRNLTIYNDRIEVGNGYYNTTQSSNYGCINSLVFFNLSTS